MTSPLSDNTEELIRARLEEPFQTGGYKLTDVHFENGRSLHSHQYIFAKKFLQNSANCDDLVDLFRSKIVSLGFEAGTTFIGYRNYTGLILNKALSVLKADNYAILEEDEGSFIWPYP